MRYCKYIIVCLLFVCCLESFGQGLRFGDHRKIAPPKDAVLRIGAFYSSLDFAQSAGYRYVSSSGVGTDYLSSSGRGLIEKDGSDFPLVSQLNSKNHLVMRNADINISLTGNYAYYPMDTQDNELNVYIVDDGIFGSLSAEIVLTPFLKCMLYDDISYKTDYLDTRGFADPYGGEQYEYFQNLLGVDADWLMSKYLNMGLSLLRKDVIPKADNFYYQEVIEYSQKLLFEYSIYSGLTVGVFASFTQSDYDDPARQDRNVDDYSAFLTFGEDRYGDMFLTSSSVLSFQAGYSQGYRSSSLQTNETDATRMTGEISLRTQLRRDLSHELSYSRGLRGGFDSAFEDIDTYSYRLDWMARSTSVSLYTDLSNVDPSRGDLNEYSDWTSGINVVCPVASYIKLFFKSAYSIRENEKEILFGDEEWINDYNTLSTRIGTTFSVTKQIDFTSYLQHVERSSDSEKLEYERDTFLATFTFKHKF